METINLKKKFDSFSDHFSQHWLGEINDCAVKAVKIQGEFIWHHHEAEDELFLVVKGTLVMKFRDHEAVVREGEFIIVPTGRRTLPRGGRRSPYRPNRAQIHAEYR